MIRSGNARKHDWRLPVYLTAVWGALVLVISDDLIQTLIIFLGAPALALTFTLLLLGAIVNKNRRTLLWIAGAIVVFFATSAALIAFQRDDPKCIRSTVRWIFESRYYKAEVLRQKQPSTAELKHVEWDGWGFAGIGNTIMYLVYNPTDSLLDASRMRKCDVIPGIPCPVDRVHRLETHWYTVLFPTDSSWTGCVRSQAQSNFPAR